MGSGPWSLCGNVEVERCWRRRHTGSGRAGRDGGRRPVSRKGPGIEGRKRVGGDGMCVCGGGGVKLSVGEEDAGERGDLVI